MQNLIWTEDWFISDVLYASTPRIFDILDEIKQAKYTPRGQSRRQT